MMVKNSPSVLGKCDDEIKRKRYPSTRFGPAQMAVSRLLERENTLPVEIRSPFGCGAADEAHASR